jgi:hypothetical protein
MARPTIASVDPRRRFPGRLRKNGRRDQQLREQGFHEPAGTKELDRGVGEPDQSAEGQEVEYRAEGTELDHEAADVGHLPAPRALDELGVDAVVGQTDGRNIGEEIVEQNMARGERKKRQGE